jgi:hypothetical protein
LTARVLTLQRLTLSVGVANASIRAIDVAGIARRIEGGGSIGAHPVGGAHRHAARAENLLRFAHRVLGKKIRHAFSSVVPRAALAHLRGVNARHLFVGQIRQTLFGIAAARASVLFIREIAGSIITGPDGSFAKVHREGIESAVRGGARRSGYRGTYALHDVAFAERALTGEALLGRAGAQRVHGQIAAFE